ncbi:MAG: hypothetical protein ACXW1U_13965 [Methylobacter sp.]
MKRLLLLLAFMAFQTHAEQYSDDPIANCLIKATEFQFVGGMRDNMTYDEAMRYRPDLAPIIQEMFRGSLAMYSTEQVHSSIQRMCMEQAEKLHK